MKMKIIKKNQLAILVISLMLITAGYLNYSTNYSGGSEMETVSKLEDSISLAELGDAELVSTNITDENAINVSENKEEKVEEEPKEENVNENKEETEAQTKTTSVESSDEYFVKSKLERNVMYSQIIERYQEIINSNSQDSTQKGVAQTEVNKINELQNAIMISENLLSSKGFNNNVIFINGESVNVIIGKEALEPSEVAQIQNIVSRELKAEVDNIHISVK